MGMSRPQCWTSWPRISCTVILKSRRGEPGGEGDEWTEPTTTIIMTSSGGAASRSNVPRWIKGNVGATSDQ